MQMNTLGRSGLSLSHFGLGTMSLLTSNSESEAIHLTHKALDAGINLIDTADIYDNGAIETVLGKALKSRRDEVVLATKIGLPMHGDPQKSGGGRAWITEAVEDSLRRLGTDYIDLYQQHRPDLKTPLEETLRAFEDLIKAGKVRQIGSSTFPAEMLIRAQWAAERENLTGFVSEQAPYSILVRGIEAEVLPTCQRYGMGALVWSPLNGGWLTGKYRRNIEAPEGSRAASGNPFVRADDEAKLTLVEQLAPLAEAAGMSLMQMSLAWTGAHPAVTSTLIGPRTEDQLDALLSAAEISLSAELLDAIDEIVAPGRNVDPRNAGWTAEGLSKAMRRR
ncbi:aldo/keto reductase [Celeribacter neptunius]|uniref:Aryl-alcohol dehydrogenase (NADP+) n=1 Tax=Celeribacter neptunius TaxID=588602 RepID=A0A1I3VQS5_9RHOB|nr:aldo/keto reductase [Celeribacter neptunius]SFJ97595.1 aryl-alcohol dehydrogenase (NADP+) [Celeribacter neptunius]